MEYWKIVFGGEKENEIYKRKYFYCKIFFWFGDLGFCKFFCYMGIKENIWGGSGVGIYFYFLLGWI